MSEMVERVARALCIGDPDALVYQPATEMVVGYREGTTPATKLVPAPPIRRWELKLDDARAAIAAMREPTEAMRELGVGALIVYDSETPQTEAAAIWRAMIDAALKDAP